MVHRRCLQPTRGQWNTFVNNPLSPIQVTSIGVGDGIDDTPLQQIDVDGHGTPINVSQFSDLIDTLVTLVGNDVTGNYVSGQTATNGADGGRILSVTFDGHTYTWNGQTGAGASISRNRAPAATRSATIGGSSTLQAIGTPLGGHFTFYFGDQWGARGRRLGLFRTAGTDRDLERNVCVRPDGQ